MEVVGWIGIGLLWLAAFAIGYEWGYGDGCKDTHRGAEVGYGKEVESDK